MGHLVLGRTERINNLHYFRFYLLSESERCFILKNDQILTVTSVYGSLLTRVKTLVSVTWYATLKGRSVKILSDIKPVRGAKRVWDHCTTCIKDIRKLKWQSMQCWLTTIKTRLKNGSWIHGSWQKACQFNVNFIIGKTLRHQQMVTSIYSAIHKYLNSGTMFVLLARYSSTLNFNLKNHFRGSKVIGLCFSAVSG